MNLNSKKIYSSLLQLVENFVHSDDHQKQNSGFLILASMCEGCHQRLSKNLENPIMNDFIKLGFNSTIPEVKGACLKAISYIVEYLPDSTMIYH